MLLDNMVENVGFWNFHHFEVASIGQAKHKYHPIYSGLGAG